MNRDRGSLMTTRRALLAYGIGSALTDLVISVNDLELTRLGLIKGFDHQVDEIALSAVMGQFLGHHFAARTGGSAANTIATMALMGAPVALSCALGNDSYGEQYIREMEEIGVVLRANCKADQGTGTCLVFVTPDGERTFQTYAGACSLLDETDVVPEFIRDSQYLYIEGYTLLWSQARKASYLAMQVAKDFGVKIAFSFSDRTVVEKCYSDISRIVTDFADLVFANEEEARTFLNSDSPFHSAELLSTSGFLACVTCSERGSYVTDGCSPIHIPAISTRVVDMTGAGDTYASGVLYGLAMGSTLANAARLGTALASRVISQVGARLTEDLRSATRNLLVL